jgi:hypothetical protein
MFAPSRAEDKFSFVSSSGTMGGEPGVCIQVRVFLKGESLMAEYNSETKISLIRTLYITGQFTCCELPLLSTKSWQVTGGRMTGFHII